MTAALPIPLAVALLALATLMILAGLYLIVTGLRP